MTPTSKKPLTIAAAVAGIVIELLAIALLAGGWIAFPVALPMIIVGMFLAFVPMFAVMRSKRRPRR
ncbi:MAG TPA: hypothetical protein VMS56_09130 [Thermoanaerobaculia bacterium]|nr:hypothetical protein [Thermoanaerobaculia bacterium]